MRVVAYARVSTNSDDQKHSLQTQIEYFSDYFKEKRFDVATCGIICRADKRRELVEGIYADEGISGTSLKNRDAFNRMMEDARAKRFDIIYTKTISRFARNLTVFRNTLDELELLGIAVYFLDIDLGSSDKTKTLLLNIFASFAEEESRHKSDIVQFGMRKAQKDGKWITHPPFGYDKVDGRLEKNPQESEVVRMIYDWYYHEGYGTGKIARTLDKMGIPTKARKKWTQWQVCRILDNPLCKGTQITHRVETTNIFAEKQRDRQSRVPLDDQYRMQREHLRIVDDELFELVQHERIKRAERSGYTFDTETGLKVRDGQQGRGRYSTETLFSNLLYCSNCGSALKRKRRHTKGKNKELLGYEWSCRMNDMYGKSRCAYRNAHPEEYLIQYVKAELVKHRKRKDELDSRLHHYLYTYFDTNNVNENLSKLDAEIQRLKLMEQKNFELYVDGDITKTLYKERHDEIHKELRKRESKRNEMLYMEERIQRVRLKYKEFIELLDSVDVNNLTNSILRKLIDRIDCHTFDEPYPDMSESDSLKVINIEWAFLDKAETEIIYDMADKDIREGFFPKRQSRFRVHRRPESAMRRIPLKAKWRSWLSVMRDLPFDE